MKKIIITLFLCLLAASAFAQDIQIGFTTESAAAKLVGTKGSVIKKEEFKQENFTGSLSGSGNFRPAIITDIRTGAKTPYIAVTSSDNGITQVSYLDYDEFSSCIEALEYIGESELDNKLNYKEISSVEVCYISKDGLQIGVINRGGIGRWQLFILQGKYARPVYIAMSARELKKLVAYLKDTKVFLEERL